MFAKSPRNLYNDDAFLDLCNEHKVTGYPQMNLYKSGEYVEKFTGAREWERLVNFIEGHREKSTHEGHNDNDVDLPEELPKIVKAEGPTHEDSNPTSSRNKNGLVVSLNSGNFIEVLNEGPVFVKFYAPWYVRFTSS